MIKLANGLLIGLVVCFPFYLWFVGWNHPVATAAYLIIAGSLRFIAGITNARSAGDWFMVLVPIVLGVLVLSVGFRVGLYYPVIVNFGLLLIFYSSLSAPKNFIQRIAETIEKQPLDSVGARYTRSVTKIWCIFFLLNALISAFLAWQQLLDKWALYNGVIAYLLIAFLLLGERLVRHQIQQKMRHPGGVAGG